MAFKVAISGLHGAYTRVRGTANNIANSSTMGFKRSRTETVESVGGGVRVSTIRPQHSQGPLQYTDNNLDLGISGQGYFRLSAGDDTVYTRAGAFALDRDGYVVNANGHRLQGFQLDGNGQLSNNLGDMRLPDGKGTPVATTRVELGLNLDATEGQPAVPFNPADVSSFNHTTTVAAYDSLGNSHSMSLYFRNTATPGQVEMYAYIDGNAVSGPDTLSFDSAGGFAGPAPLSLPAHDPMNGAAPMAIRVDLGATTRYAAKFDIREVHQDGASSGDAAGITVGDDGRVSALYSNGQSRVIGQVALADFQNPQGLRHLGDGLYGAAHEAGDAIYGEPGSGTLGRIVPGSLEDSNVDLAQELVDLKRAEYEVQANMKVIQVEDAMLGALFKAKA